MPVEDINVIKNKNVKKSRRRKKRRTADISDSSESDSSSSSSDSDIQVNADDNKNSVNSKNGQRIDQPLSDIELSDDDLPKKSQYNDELLSQDTKEKLSNIHYTTTELTQRFTQNHKYDHNHNTDLKKVGEILREATSNLNKASSKTASADLQNEYLGMLFQNYGDDINSLRNAPDFTNKSLVLLANVLKDGSKMFDVDTLKALVESK